MKYYKYLSIIALSLSLTNCSESNNYSEFYDGVLSLSKPGIKTLQSYDVGLQQTDDIFIQRGGFTTTPSTIDIVVDETIIDSINIAQGKNLQLLPKGCYEIITPQVNIAGEDRLFKGQVRFDPAKILEANGGVYEQNNFILPLRMVSKGMPFFKGRSEIIYDFRVSEAIVTLTNKGVTSINGDVASVNVAVPFPNQWEITTTTFVDEDFVTKYNSTNRTYFDLLPADCYSSEQVGRMTKEDNSCTIEYQINNSNLKSGNYLLPIKLKDITAEVAIKKDEKAAAVFKIVKLGERVSKENWEIVSKTTEEVSGEGPNNGRAIHLIDGKDETFWHSKWQGGQTALPYEFVIDMKKRIDIAQVEVKPRGGNTNNPLKLLQFYVSDDNSDWTFIGEFSFTNINDYLVYNVKKHAGRYLKMVIPDAGGNGTIAAIRELQVRGEILD